MSKQIPSYLKLVTDTSYQGPAAPIEDLAAVHEAFAAFEHATGWKLEYAEGAGLNELSNLMWSAPVNPGVGASPGHIRLLSPSDETRESPRVPLEQASRLAAALGKLWAELLGTRHALWQREAELAVGVPLVIRDDEPAQLGEQLEAVLRGGAEAIGCDAAALYLLDPATTELKLRSSWGLPRKRLAEPARPLRGSLADLEALLGHAVVLADDELHDYWKVPEEGFGSCVCVPISSATMPLGTLWAFRHEPGDFNAAQTNILEVVAGRVAADLERQVLLDEALAARDHVKEISAAGQSQQEQLPRVAPLIDGWDVAAKAFHVGRVGGTFYDWFSLDDGSLAVLAGDARQGGIAGALTASALRAAARAFAPQPTGAHLLLERANSILWTGSAGNQSADLFQAILEPSGRSCVIAAAGAFHILAVRSKGHASLAGPSACLGLQEEMRLAEMQCKLAPGELLVVYGTGFSAADDEALLVNLDERLALALEPCCDLRAEQLAEIADRVLQDAAGVGAADRVALIIKRRRR